MAIRAEAVVAGRWGQEEKETGGRRKKNRGCGVGVVKKMGEETHHNNSNTHYPHSAET